MIEIFGYSERGMMNAIAYDIAYSEHAKDILPQFISWFTFPKNARDDGKVIIKKVEKITMIVEQSFSDFGDLDMLLLVDHDDGQRKAFLIEAKVKTFSKGSWSILDEWNDFQLHLRNPGNSTTANLFVQLYRKQRLNKCIRDNLPIDLGSDSIASKYRIGNNKIVRQAAERLKPYVNDFSFVMLVPENSGMMNSFFNNQLIGFNYGQYLLPSWDIRQWGYLTWRDLERSVRKHESVFRRVIDNFNYNHGQIYNNVEELQRLSPEPDGIKKNLANDTAYIYNGEPVLAVDCSTNNCRVVPIQYETDYFPRSFLISSQLQLPVYTSPVMKESLRPQREFVYAWNRPGEKECEKIKITVKGWERSRAVKVGDFDSKSFLVPNHEVRRS